MAMLHCQRTIEDDVPLGLDKDGDILLHDHHNIQLPGPGPQLNGMGKNALVLRRHPNVGGSEHVSNDPEANSRLGLESPEQQCGETCYVSNLLIPRAAFNSKFIEKP